MTAAPLQLVNQAPENQKPSGTPEWVKYLVIAALVSALIVVIANLNIVNRRYGPGRR